jgi:hypothetical protein
MLPRPREHLLPHKSNLSIETRRFLDVRAAGLDLAVPGASARRMRRSSPGEDEGRPRITQCPGCPISRPGSSLPIARSNSRRALTKVVIKIGEGVGMRPETPHQIPRRSLDQMLVVGSYRATRPTSIEGNRQGSLSLSRERALTRPHSQATVETSLAGTAPLP